MRPESTVYPDFQHFQIDNDESYIHQQVQKACYGPGAHFALPQCHTGHGCPPLRPAVGAVNGLAEHNIAADFPQTLRKKTQAYRQKDDEQDIIQILHTVTELFFNNFIITAKNRKIYITFGVGFNIFYQFIEVLTSRSQIVIQCLIVNKFSQRTVSSVYLGHHGI